MLIYYEWKQNSRQFVRNLIFVVIFLIISFLLVSQALIYIKSLSEIEKAKESFPTIALVRLPERVSESNGWIPEYMNNEELNIFQENPYVIMVDDRVMMTGINLSMSNSRESFIYFKGIVEDYSSSNNNGTMKIKVETPYLNCDWKSGQIVSIKYQQDILKTPMEIGKSYYVEVRDNQNIRTLYNLIPENEGIEYSYFNRQTVAQMENSTFGLLYTKDMETIYSVHKGNIKIIQGRAFLPEDYMNQEVCIIHQSIAEKNEMKVGDTIEFSVAESYSFINSTPIGKFILDDPAWRQASYMSIEDNEVVSPLNIDNIMGELAKVSYMIVGIYENREDRRYKNNNSGGEDYIDIDTVILPYDTRDSLYSRLGYDRNDTVCDQFISLKLKTGYEEEFFEYLDKQGYEEDRFVITIDDSNFTYVKMILESMKDNALRYVIILACAVLTILVLYSYLYIDMNRKKYMIMKRLGVTELKSKGVLYLSMMISAFIGVFIGGIMGYVYTRNIIKDSYESTIVKLYGEEFSLDKQLNSLYTFNESISISYAILIVFSVLILLTMVYMIWFKKVEK